LAQKIGLLPSVGIFQGFLGEFLGYLEWLGSNRKYFFRNRGSCGNFSICVGTAAKFTCSSGTSMQYAKSGGLSPRRVDRAAQLESIVD
jgi:hypothetical protein